jgi:hypothetical protein
MREIKTALKFQKAGIRADLPIAGIFIEQIPLHAMKIGPPSRTELTYSKISIKEARKRGLLAKGTGRPVILLRAFGTKFRVMDLAVHDTAREQREMINDAKAVLSRELGRKLTDKEYVEWFATNLGEQIARMHANGWTNQYIDAHNVTLDGRIVDLEGVRKLNSRRARHADEMAAYRCLSSFIGGCKLLGIDTSTSLKERFLVKYHELYDELRKRR